jgi:uncharacterized membrane protein
MFGYLFSILLFLIIYLGGGLRDILTAKKKSAKSRKLTRKFFCEVIFNTQKKILQEKCGQAA